jgi:hypothetical protein
MSVLYAEDRRQDYSEEAKQQSGGAKNFAVNNIINMYRLLSGIIIVILLLAAVSDQDHKHCLNFIRGSRL